MVCSIGNANFENFLNTPFGEKSQNLTYESKITKVPFTQPPYRCEPIIANFASVTEVIFEGLSLLQNWRYSTDFFHVAYYMAKLQSYILHMRAECFIICFNDRSEFYMVVNALKMMLLSWYFACGILLGIQFKSMNPRYNIQCLAKTWIHFTLY